MWEGLYAPTHFRPVLTDRPFLWWRRDYQPATGHLCRLRARAQLARATPPPGPVQQIWPGPLLLIGAAPILAYLEAAAAQLLDLQPYLSIIAGGAA